MSDSVYLPRDHFDGAWDQETLEPDDLETSEALEPFEFVEEAEQIAEVSQRNTQGATEEWNDHGMDELITATIGFESSEKDDIQHQMNSGPPNH